MFVYNGLTTLCGVFILHLLRKARGCCMHVFSSINSIIWRVIAHRIVHGDLLRSKSVKKFLFTTLYSREQSNTFSPLRRSSSGNCVYMENSQPGHPRSRVSRGGISLRRVSLGIRAGSPNINRLQACHAEWFYRRSEVTDYVRTRIAHLFHYFDKMAGVNNSGISKQSSLEAIMPSTKVLR